MSYLLSFLFAACGPTGGTYHPRGDDSDASDTSFDLATTPYDLGSAPPPDLANPNPQDMGDAGGGPIGCVEANGCYTVYAHGDHILYKVDLANKMLLTVGAFKAPMVGGSEDVITDLAVAPDDTIYVVSKTTLYTASAVDGHVTTVAPLASCGSQAVALTFTPDGSLYSADFQGAFCKIDLMTKQVTQVGTIGGGFAIAGDIVAVKDGTVYGTAYKISDGNNAGTGLNNVLVKINPANGQATQMIGATGFPKMFGVAYALGQVFGFTHDGSGDVATIDPATGKGTLYNSFKDPNTNKGISFAGAGVNPMVSPTITH
jgi:hypothetical protein